MVYKMESIRVLIVCFCSVAMTTTKAANLKQRLAIVESDLNTLALKTDIAAENIDENARSLVELNRTIDELGQCFVCEHDGTIETADNGRCASINDRQRREVIAAFEQEKSYVRKQVRSMSKAISDFEEDRRLSNELAASVSKALRTEMKALALADEQHKREIDTLALENIELKQSAAADIKTIRTELNEALALVEERHRTEVSKAAERHKLEIESLKNAHQTDLSNLKALINKTCLNACQDVNASKAEADLVKTCPQNWTERDTFCYKWFASYSSYEEARIECSSHGAFLLDVEDVNEYNFVLSRTYFPYMWLGLQHRASDGLWVWERSGKEVDYTYWAANRPNNQGNCAIVWRKTGYWLNWPCDGGFENWFVCKMKAREKS